MKRILLTSLLLLPTLVFAASIDHLTMKDAYVRAMPAGQPTTAAYVAITNDSDKAIKITGVSSPVAKKAELHEVVFTDGVAKMQEIKSITLDAKSTTMLTPGGMHVMLLGLKDAVKVGSTVPVTFTFDDGKTKMVDMPVQDIRTESKQTHTHQ